MRTTTLAISILLLVSSCMEQPRSSGRTSESSTVTTTTNAPQFESGPGSGSADIELNPIEFEKVIIGSGAFDSNDQNEQQEGVELEQYCGKLYRSSSELYLLVDQAEKYWLIFPDGSGAQSVLDGMSFPYDAYNACVWGEKGAAPNKEHITNHIFAPNIQLNSAVAHPERADEGQGYSHVKCGTVKWYTSNTLGTKLEIWTSTFVYILEDHPSALASIVNNSPSEETKGCVYSNTVEYKQTELTFKRFFDVEHYSVGW